VDAATGRDLGILPGSAGTSTLGGVGTSTVNAFALSLDGRVLATADDGGAVRLWDVATRKQIGAMISTDANGVSGLAFNPDGRILATSDGDGTVRLWDVAANPQIIGPHDATAAIAEAEMTRDGKTMTTVDANGAIHVWDAATGEQISAIPAVDTGFFPGAAGRQQGISEAALSPDGKALAVAHNGTVELWDVAAGRKAGTLIGSRVFAHWLDSLAFSPDSTSLAVGDNYGHITLWNAATDR
jgi:WD40 repeat protein